MSKKDTQEKLNTEYVKNIESKNDQLDITNYKLNKEHEELKKQLKQLKGANEELSICLGVLLERADSNADVGTKKFIMDILASVTKKLNKEKY